MKAKKTIRIFISNATADENLISKLLKELKTLCKLSAQYTFEFWDDSLIPLGTHWNERIHAALQECDCGLILISHDYLASNYIRKIEVRRLLKLGKPIIPVYIKEVPPEVDWGGLLDLQIFALRNDTMKIGRPYMDCGTSAQKHKFVVGLFNELQRRLAHEDTTQKPAPNSLPPPGNSPMAKKIRKLRKKFRRS